MRYCYDPYVFLLLLSVIHSTKDDMCDNGDNSVCVYRDALSIAEFISSNCIDVLVSSLWLAYSICCLSFVALTLGTSRVARDRVA